jgi:hypothetical protein
LVDLTSLVPLSFEGEGEEILERGQSPSLTFTPPSLKEVDEVLA